MKIATYWHEGTRHVGRLSDDGGSVTPLIAGEQARESGALALVEGMALGLSLPAEAGPPVSLAAVRLDAPLRPRRNIFCVGKNYHEHAREFAQSGFDSRPATPGTISRAIPSSFPRCPTP